LISDSTGCAGNAAGGSTGMHQTAFIKDHYSKAIHVKFCQKAEKSHPLYTKGGWLFYLQ